MSPTAVAVSTVPPTRNPAAASPPARSHMPVGNAQAVRAGPPPISHSLQNGSSSSGGTSGGSDSSRPPKSSGGGGGGGARAPKFKDSKTKYGLWSSNMAYYSAVAMFCFGVIGFVWAKKEQDPAPIYSDDFTLYCSLYSFFLGILIVLWEWFFGRKRGASSIPLRGIVYVILSLFLFVSWPTMLAGFFLFITGITNFVATAMGEVYDAPPAKVTPESKPLTAAESRAEGPIGAIKVYFAQIQQQNKAGRFIFISLYIAGNIAFFAYTVNLWEGKVADARAIAQDNEELVPTGWAPWAKGFGATLDLNCALILLPVLRTMIRWLYNRSTADQGCISMTLRGILYFVPLDENLSFHKLTAKVILFATVAHTLVHYVNFALRPRAVLNLFDGAWPLVSGGIVCLSMFFIYTSENRKQTNTLQHATQQT